jgi:hypothetical protein
VLDHCAEGFFLAQFLLPKPLIDKLATNLTFQSAEQASSTQGVLSPKLIGDKENFLFVRKPAQGFKLAWQIVPPN